MATLEDTTTTGRTHGIGACLSDVSAALSAVAQVPGWSLSPAEQRAALVELAAAEARLTELRFRVLAAGDANEIGLESGAGSTAAWVAHATRQVRREANADLRLAVDLAGEFEATRAAMAAGRVSREQAQVVVVAIRQLGAEVPEEWRRESERHLLELAAHFDAKGLRQAGARLFEVLDPESAERREGERLAAEEQEARRTARFAMRDNGDGTCSGTFKLPVLQAEMLRKALSALTAPSHTGKEARFDADGHKLPYPTLLGHAFGELIEHLPVDRLPALNTMAASIIVKIDYQALLSGLGVAVLETGTRISAAEARRLACEARIIPAVMGGASEVLDLGRGRREFSPAQRTAMLLTRYGCAAETCDRPAYLTHAHHLVRWCDGGPTDLDKAVALCPWHHSLAHRPDFEAEYRPGGTVRFHRRT